MSALPQNAPISEEAYLARDRASNTRLEWMNGTVYAMSGASEAHIDITGNLFAGLHTQLRGKPCKVYQSDMRVRVSPSGAYFYPDVVAVCGERIFLPDETVATLLNPTLIVEVLSPSTETIDKIARFNHYTQLASLQDYLLVAQHTPQIERYQRQANGWMYTALSGIEQTLMLSAIGCELPFAAIYAGVSLGDS